MKKIIISFMLLFSLMGVNNSFATDTFSIDSINGEENSYLYFYGDGCSHCAKVDSYLNKTDGYNLLNIEKKEVYNDDDNRTQMLEAATRLGISESDVGVPFVVVTDPLGVETGLIGDTDIINHFKTYLGEPESNENNKTIVLVVLGLLAVIIPTVIISSLNKKQTGK